MEAQFEFNPLLLTVTAILSLIFLWYINRTFLSLKPPNTKKLPPSPPKLPIIGNLHQLSSHPHHDIHSLAQKHGPIMLLRFGSAPVLVVSSAEVAREITRAHDIAFANRPQFKAMTKLLYGSKDVATAPYGEYWRKMRSIFVLQLLSNQRVQSFRSIRVEETALFVKKVREASSKGKAVDLSAMFKNFTNDGISRAAFGMKYSESENGGKFMRAMKEMMELLGLINVGDFVPWLDWIGRVNGFDKRLDRTAKEMDEILEGLINDREKEIDQREKVNGNQVILDILMEIYNDETIDASIDRSSIKSLLLDVFVGGTDSISTALEWTMSEILRNPTVMEKLQKEVRGIVKEKEEIGNEDLEKMHYLKAVIKEALRMHPPFPLLVPRVCSKDVQIRGFDVEAGTILMINGWAIGRDPISWDEPDKFKPERFLNSSIDFKGHDFELIPFGAGRRGCPGITFSVAAMEILLANLVQKFEWRLGDGVEGKDLDMNESPGMSAVHRAVPLLAVASSPTK